MNVKNLIRHIATKVYLVIKEKKYAGRLKYLYEKHSSDTLIVVFSGFADKPVYNYIRTLNNVKADKMFILDDFGYKGSYYWYENGHDYPMTLANSLIMCKLIRGGYKRLITLGSSKGGTCAIYFGLKFGASDIFSGACQYRVGTYLNADDRVPVFLAMMGTDAGEKEQAILDAKMPELINSCGNSTSIVHLLYSKEEHTYHDDIQYLIKDLDANKIKHIDKVEHFTDHGEVGKYFSPWVKEEIRKVIGNE